MRRIGKDKPSALDERIGEILDSMKAFGPDSEEYPALVAHLERLTHLRADEGHRRKISPDTMAIVVGNLVGILIIVIYEQRHVMVSKGMGMLLRPKSTNT